MKTLKLFLFLLLPLSLMGQEKIDTLRRIATLGVAYQHTQQTDTIAVWMNCADTTGGRKIAYNVSILGWEVRLPDDKYTPIYGVDPQHVCYLDYFKRPLTGYLVWATEEIK